MATIKELSDALIQADAAGDTAGATVLAKALRQQQALGGQIDAPQSSPQPTQHPSLLGSTLSTLNHAVTDLPIVGPALQWTGDNIAAQTIGRLSGQDPATWLKNAQASKAAMDAANPVAAAAGGIAGNVAALGGAGIGSDIAANALGMTGKLVPRMVNSALSTTGLSAADNMVRGQAPTTALANALGPGAVAAAVPVAGQAVARGINAGADALNGIRQTPVTNAAIANAPTAQGIKNVATDAFDRSVNNNPIPISDTAYMRFMGDVQNALKKYRPNSANDPKTVGLLGHLTDLADAANTPGTVVDLKDIHLARQLANQVGQEPGRDGEMGRIVVDKMDDFVNGLKPSDILGGTNPSQAASDLMAGISGWHQGILAGKVEDAISQADTYKSGMEMGLKNSFTALMKDPAYGQFSPQAQDAIRTVAKGTTAQNAMALLGRAGFSLGGGGGHNIIGGTLGAAAGTGALTPFLGPMAAPVSLGLSMAASGAGRAAADSIAMKNATRAAQIAATPNIPTVAPVQIPQLIQSASPSLETILRGALMNQASQ